VSLRTLEVWFVTGSQHLYGKETLDRVAEHSKQIASSLDQASPLRVVWKPVLTTAEAIRDICLEANNAKHCAGLVLWMHTFSPVKCGLLD
jgi:L-arabinose isomerase